MEYSDLLVQLDEEREYVKALEALLIANKIPLPQREKVPPAFTF